MARTRQPYKPRHLTLPLEQKATWQRDHYGAFAWIGRKTGFSREYVRQVFFRVRGRSNETIDRLLDAVVLADRQISSRST